jgi:hypothetical protein
MLVRSRGRPRSTRIEFGARRAVVVAVEAQGQLADRSTRSKTSAPSCSRTVSPSRRPSRRMVLAQRLVLVLADV